ncbi:hypothetical protein GTP38_21940 [Duganella sp. FT94W]|uniref:Uncharacterized protein n=1 Tax=Duganella lactea TaxID=2692173 RepID=A0ABW9VC45_9BURK|nr:hypothetical protein [Duganella lactea]MYM36993.1 hypothetical protein [Duganella lactea]
MLKEGPGFFGDFQLGILMTGEAAEPARITFFTAGLRMAAAFALAARRAYR